MGKIEGEARHEILRRGEKHAHQSRLVVDFYRIRRQLAYPVPIRECSFPRFPTRLSTWYPWDCWLAWAMEERVLSLGWAATLSDAPRLRFSTEADLQGIAAWKYDDLEKTDGLAVSHLVRMLVTAKEHWAWLSFTTHAAIDKGLNHLISRFAAWLEAERDWWRRRESDPDHADFSNPLHNIHFIQTVGLCLAARNGKHSCSEWLESHMRRFALALLDQHASGVSEGVSYDGYVLDFMMDWITGAPAAMREAILIHPELQEILNQPAIIGAPGNLMQVAPLGDVEALEMPFHVSALAKWRRLQNSGRHDWQLSQFDPRFLRTDALATIIAGPAHRADSIEPVGNRTRAAIVLRSGDTLTDTAVAMSAHAAQMGHLHHDNGSIVIAAGGEWIINDPGYQQYMGTSEREFSVGPAAHNAPVINGIAQTKRAGRIIQEPAMVNGSWHAKHDLRGCYDLPLTKCTRSLWLTGNSLVVVADEISGSGIDEITYHWHGHSDAAWWVEDGIALVCLNNTQLWIRCMNCALDAAQVDRMRGSRGHLTLQVRIKGAPSQSVWWVFGRDEATLRTLTMNDDEVPGYSARHVSTE